ncbi:hypothetical protein QJS10_CPB20g01694 [Acorus calamus]|uniref:Receptor-like protein 51 n=1 Tax=Acorus calamus TaxID=4465 RepID=A0AAV9CCK4_ACOCL|nr:hypothetical protein QJS10_CPB20g01694 [Acorus calamus]
MELKILSTLLFILLLISTTSTSSKTPPSIPKSTLDPKQISALQSLYLPVTPDPCLNPTNATTCDSASPFRHVTSLRLSNCSRDLQISPTALRALSTVRSLSLSNCPSLPRVPLPLALASNLRSFACAHAFSGGLTGVWLSRLANLTDLTVSDVSIKASGASIVLSRMSAVRSVVLTRCNLTGSLPRHWHSNLTRIDFSDNRIAGTIHSSISALSGGLRFLNLSHNGIHGEIPDAFGELVSLENVSLAYNSLSGPIPESVSGMSGLVHLDLSSNKFNGSMPRFLADLPGLKHLNLENNEFRGVIPFNVSFIKRLQVLKVGGNSGLCYNHTVLSSKLKLGIAPCDRDGFPVSPPPQRDDSPSPDDDGADTSDGGGDGEARKDEHRHGPSKLVLGVAIGLSSVVFLIIFFVLLSRCCR